MIILGYFHIFPFQAFWCISSKKFFWSLWPSELEKRPLADADAGRAQAQRLHGGPEVVVWR